MNGVIFFVCSTSWFFFVFFVEEDSRKEDRRRACGIETEADMLDFNKLIESKTCFFFWFGCFQYTRESAVGFKFCYQGARGNMCKTESKTQQRILKSVAQSVSGEHMESCAEWCVWAFRSSWKQVQDVVNKFERTRLRFHNMQISDYRYVDKMFENFRQTLCLKSNVFDEKTSVLIWDFLFQQPWKHQFILVGVRNIWWRT